MALKLSEGSNYTPAPAGLHNAICVNVVDLGMQAGQFGVKPKILLAWELPDCLMDDGRPYVISRQFGATLSKQGNLRPIVDAWRGKSLTAEEARSFDMSKLLGRPCKLLIQHSTSDDGRTFANIQAALKPEAGQPTTAQNELVFYDQDAPDPIAKSKLPEWIRTVIDKAVVVQKPTPTNTAPESDKAAFDDDLTF